MPESVSVQGLGAPTQEVPEGTGGVAPLHDAGLVHWSPPSRKVVRRCEGIGACPYCKRHHPSRHLEDGRLPADVLPFLLKQAEHLPLERGGLHCLGAVLLIDLGDFLFGSLQDLRFLDSDSYRKG